MPSQEILKKYADVLVKCALWGGKGLQIGEGVTISIDESAKQFILPLQTSVLEAGGYPIFVYNPEGLAKNYYENANDEQLIYNPKNMLLGRLKDSSHVISILSTNDPFELKDIDTKKIMKRTQSRKFYKDAWKAKEDQGKFFWTLGLFGTEAMAKEAGMSLEQYWDQIIKACYLNESDPVARWKVLFEEQIEFKRKLNDLKIREIHIEGESVDLKVLIGENRKWVCGGGNNIPSFEIFTSPDWRGTNGRVKFDSPLYTQGTVVKDIELEFKDGVVVSARAGENQKYIEEYLKIENADKLGEISLTDKRHSKIDRFMAETLFDENYGGEYGNFHLALGSSYSETYNGDKKELTKEMQEELGFNDSSVHTDIISTTNRQVTAQLENGSSQIIYKDGQFIF